MVKYNVNNRVKKKVKYRDLKSGEYFIFVDGEDIRLKLDEDIYFNTNICDVINFVDSFYSRDSYVYPLNAEVSLSYACEGEDE